MHLAKGQDNAPHRAFLQRPLTPGRCPCIVLRAARAVPVGAFAGSDGTVTRKNTHQSLRALPHLSYELTLKHMIDNASLHWMTCIWLGHVLHDLTANVTCTGAVQACHLQESHACQESQQLPTFHPAGHLTVVTVEAYTPTRLVC